MNSNGLTCNVCSLVFDNLTKQRAHMREPWHVYNIKRRMSSLPPITFQVFSEQIHDSEKPLAGPSTTAELDATATNSNQNTLESQDDTLFNDEQNDTDTEELSLTQCLFCNENSPSFAHNLEHMLSRHGLFIPEVEYVTDMKSFIGYIGSIIITHHECLYCGTVKSSTDGIRAHMIDKGHCLLNFEGEPELLEFWQFPDSDGDEGQDQDHDRRSAKAKLVSETELSLPSGVIVESRAWKSRNRNNLKKRSATRQAKMKAIEAGDSSGVQPRSDRRVAVRGELGLIGISDQQKRSLMVVEKKIQKREVVSQAAHRWAKEKVANKQKVYKPLGSGLPGVHT